MYDSRIKCDKSAFTSCVRICTQKQQANKKIVAVFKQIKMSEEITKIVANSLFSIYFFLKYDHKAVRSQLLRQAKSLILSHLVSYLSLFTVSTHVWADKQL